MGEIKIIDEWREYLEDVNPYIRCEVRYQIYMQGKDLFRSREIVAINKNDSKEDIVGMEQKFLCTID